MQTRMMLLLLAGAIAVPVHATMTVVLPATPVPALGLLGVAATGVVALVIGWWRMRK